MGDILFRWKILGSPDSLNFDFENIPLARALPDVHHYHGVPFSAHLSASVKALQAV